MANNYIQLDVSSSQAFADNLKAALIAKYGEDGVTIHYSSGRLVFSCPAISDYVFSVTRSGLEYWNYGTSYASGTTLNGSTSFYYNQDAVSIAHMVLGDSFLFMTGRTGSARFITIIAKTVGGKSVIGAGNSNTTQGSSRCATKDLTTNQPIHFVDFGSIASNCNTNTPYKTKLLLAYDMASGDQLLRQADGTPDTIEGLYMSTYANADAPDHIAVSNALLSARILYCNGITVNRYTTSILAEFDA